MAIKNKNVSVCSDGTEFDTKAEAERHEALIEYARSRITNTRSIRTERRREGQIERMVKDLSNFLQVYAIDLDLGKFDASKLQTKDKRTAAAPEQQEPESGGADKPKEKPKPKPKPKPRAAGTAKKSQTKKE